MSDAGRPPDDPEASGRLLFALALLVGALLRLILLGNPDLFGGDEGAWAVGARNLVEGGLGQLLGLSRTPLGEPAGIPPLFPALLSVMVRIFGAQEWVVRLPSVGAGLVGAFVLERIVRRGYGQPAGHLAGAFAALFPPLVAASRAATVEPTLVALGLAGIIFGLRALEEDLPVEGAVAGAFFGLAFLAKGYAAGLFVAPLLVALAARRQVLALGRTKKSLALMAAGFVLVGGAHLLLVAILRPSAFGFHLASAFGSSPQAARAAFEATAFGADLKTIVGTLFLFLPVFGVGVAFLGRRVGEAEEESGATSGERRLAHGALWGAYAIECLIVIVVSGRLRLNSIPVMPVLAAMTGLGAAALRNPAADGRGRSRERLAALVSGAIVLVVAALLMAAPDDPLFGGRSHPVGAGSALAAIAASAVGAAILASGLPGRFGGRIATALLAALLAAAGIESMHWIRRDLLTHRTGAREVAEQIAPALAPLSPQELSFRSAEPDALAFRLFRTGRSFSGVPSAEVLSREAEETRIRCWAYRDGAAPGAAAPPLDARAWLASSARDVTAEVDARAGRATGLRVFVPAGR